MCSAMRVFGRVRKELPPEPPRVAQMVACLILLEKKYSCRLGQVFVEKRTLYAAVSACESHICSSGYIEVKEVRFCEKKRIPSCIPDESPKTRRVIEKNPLDRCKGWGIRKVAEGGVG